MKLVLFCFLLTLPSSATAQQQQATPYLALDHWAYRYVDLLQERGLLKSLVFSVRPYTRAEILNAIASVDPSAVTPAERYWIEIIKSELELNSTGDNKLDILLRAGSSGAGKTVNSNADLDLALFPEISIGSTYFAGSIRGRFDNVLINDPLYTGYRTGLFGARVEEGYGLVRIGIVSFYFGRLANAWSPFRTESLILSPHAYTYDQVGVAIATKYVSFRSFHSQLSEIGTARRYLSIHRLDVKLPGNIQLGFSESVIYGGNNQQTELAYVNPFNVYAAVQLNEHKEANEFLAFDARVPYRNFAAKIQVLVDDFILDGPSKPPPNRKTSSDRLGVIVGLTASDFLVNASLAELEYARVGSYTYNIKSSRPYQAYTHYGKGIGASDNDFDRWRFVYTYFPWKRFTLSMALVYERAGERSLTSNDFLDDTFVKLPFPSGVVQRTSSLTSGISYLHSRSWNTRLQAGLSSINQFNNLPSTSRHRLNIALTTEFAVNSWLALDLAE